MKVLWLKIVKYKKWFIIGLVTIAVVKAGFMYDNSRTKTTTALQVINVERGDLSLIITATGIIKPVNMVDISSKITAQIKELKVKENERVTAGQVLVVLEDTGLQAQVIQAQERLNNAADNYVQNQRLNKVGALSNRLLKDSAMEYRIAQASYDEIVSKFNESVITSPIAGVVIGKPLPAGQMVAQGVNNPTVILTVADMSKMQIEARVDETDIGKIAVGQKVSFTVDAHSDKTFAGMVSVISQKATVEQNVIYYMVVIDVTDTHDLLKPSMTARVSIAASERKNVLNLPLTAIQTSKNGKYVVVMGEDGQTRNMPVTTGVMEDDRVEIMSGLQETDQVVMPRSKNTLPVSGQKPTGQAGGISNPLGGIMRRM